MLGVDPPSFAAHVAHAICCDRVALGIFELLQHLGSAFRKGRRLDERIGGWIASADPLERAVLLGY